VINIKLQPIDAAKKFVQKHYPNCQGAILAGSVVRGEATATSDLDIVIFDKTLDSSYRESLIEFGWAIEVFVHSLTSYKQYFELDYERARPSLPRMVSEGIVLKDEGVIDCIKEAAQNLLNRGPKVWTEDTIKLKRYFISDALDDFKGCTNRSEEIFIANTLAELLSEFVLRTNNKWIGASKWVYRCLRDYDKQFATNFVEAFDTFYKTGNKEQIILITEQIVRPYGGLLFEGFTLGKK